MIIHAKSAAGGSGSQLTTTPFTEAVAKAFDRPDINSEFGRASDILRLFGIKRGYLYGLEKAGLIKTVALRAPGTLKGCKLFHIASVRAFLHAKMEKTSAAIADANAEADR